MTLPLPFPHESEPGYVLTRWGHYGCRGCGAWEQPVPNGCDLPRFPHARDFADSDEGAPCRFAGER